MSKSVTAIMCVVFMWSVCAESHGVWQEVRTNLSPSRYLFEIGTEHDGTLWLARTSSENKQPVVPQ